MENESEYDTEGALRKVAELEIEQTSRDLHSILDQHSSNYKWITSSLLILNSGSAVAILNSEFIYQIGKINAVIFNIAGIVLALSVAWLSQLLTTKMLGPLVFYRVYWVKILNGHAYDENEEIGERDKIRSSRKLASWIVPLAGWLSLASFVGSMTTASLHISKSHGDHVISEQSGSVVKSTKQ